MLVCVITNFSRDKGLDRKVRKNITFSSFLRCGSWAMVSMIMAIMG